MDIGGPTLNADIEEGQIIDGSSSTALAINVLTAPNDPSTCNPLSSSSTLTHTPTIEYIQVANLSGVAMKINPLETKNKN